MARKGFKGFKAAKATFAKGKPKPFYSPTLITGSKAQIKAALPKKPKITKAKKGAKPKAFFDPILNPRSVSPQKRSQQIKAAVPSGFSATPKATPTKRIKGETIEQFLSRTKGQTKGQVDNQKMLPGEAISDYLKRTGADPRSSSFKKRQDVKKPGYGVPLNILKGGAEMGQAATRGLVEGTGNILGALMDLVPAPNNLTPEQKEQWKKEQLVSGDTFRGGGKYLSDIVSKGSEILGKEGVKGAELNPESGASAVGGVLGNIASQVPAMMLGSNITNTVKGIPILGKLGSGWGGNLARNVIGEVAGGAVGTEGAAAATESRFASPQELAMGAAIDTGGVIASEALQKFSKSAYDKFLGFSKGKAGKLADKGVDPAKALAEKGYISFSRQGMSEKIGQDIKSLSNKLDDLIAEADSIGSSKSLAKLDQQMKNFGFTADDLLKNVDTVIANSKLKPKFGEIKTVKKQIQTAINEFEQTMGNKVVSLVDVQNLKKKLGNSLSSYFAKAGDAKAQAKELVNDIIRKNAKEIIEINVQGAKSLNKEMGPLIEAQKQLKKTGNYSGTLGDLLVGTALGGSSLASGESDPTKIITNIVSGLAIKHGLMSPGGRSLRGNFLMQLSKAAESTTGKQALKNLLFGKQSEKEQKKSLEEIFKNDTLPTKKRSLEEIFAD